MNSELQSDLTTEELTEIEAGSLYNQDLAPIRSDARKWGTKDIAFLWVGMSVCIPTYMLASSLISDGMNWWQAILTVALGNLIVLAPMILNGHAGTKYGITFPVFARAAFGVNGTHIASILRGIVALRLVRDSSMDWRHGHLRHRLPSVTWIGQFHGS
jgi:NCS1 family nucleobase:cation symporter-1